MKKQSNLSRLLEIAGSHKYLTYASWVLSAISALIALVPFYYIWKIIKEVLEVAPNFAQAQNLTGNGWMAVLFAVIAVLVYIAGLETGTIEPCSGCAGLSDHDDNDRKADAGKDERIPECAG